MVGVWLCCVSIACLCPPRPAPALPSLAAALARPRHCREGASDKLRAMLGLVAHPHFGTSWAWQAPSSIFMCAKKLREML